MAAVPGALCPQRHGARRQERTPRVVSAFIATAYAQETPEAASGQWRKVADRLRPGVPKLARMMDTAEEDVPAYMYVPAAAQHQSARAPERRDQAAHRRRRAYALCATLPNEDAFTRLVGALLLEQNDEWAEHPKVPAMHSIDGKGVEGVQRGRYMTLGTVAQLSDDPTVTLPAMAA